MHGQRGTALARDVCGPRGMVEIPVPQKTPVAIWWGIGGGLLAVAAVWLLMKKLEGTKKRKSPPALALASLTELAATGLTVRPNAPYAGTGPALVTSLRAARAAHRYAGIEIETSHALVRQPNGCMRVANALTHALRRIMARDNP